MYGFLTSMQAFYRNKKLGILKIIATSKFCLFSIIGYMLILGFTTHVHAGASFYQEQEVLCTQYSSHSSAYKINCFSSLQDLVVNDIIVDINEHDTDDDENSIDCNKKFKHTAHVAHILAKVITTNYIRSRLLHFELKANSQSGTSLIVLFHAWRTHISLV